MFSSLSATATRLLLTATLAFGASAPALAASPSLDPIPLIEGWLLPRYEALSAAAAAQSGAWTGFCAKPAAAGVPALKDAYGKTADAWNAVEFITFGPISLSLRADRISFFPDRRNAISRGLAEILADTDAARLEPERFSQASAAVQGLPALERLLYEEGAAEALVSGPEAARRCALGTAIARNLATITAEVRTQWGDRGAGVLGAIVSGKGDPALFPDLGALPGMILTDLSGAFQRVTDTKLMPVMGSSPADAKPTLADSWRSGRSSRIAANMVRSADALLTAVAAQMPSRPQYVVTKAATTADAAAEKLPPDLGAAVATAQGVSTIQTSIKAFKAAQLAVYKPIAAYFGISLGFNALDGD
ncbi:imelysin family protein [Xanthobacter autotrophicus DSM 431]|uniref:imelysin family protein n=1 Tax=Xanthobacter nonsaccharivorans TaxID=3119912 RepID=UPI0037267825